MRGILIVFLCSFLGACSLEKSMNNDEFDAVISKLGGSPEKNSVEENIMVGDAFRKSNRLVESVPYYQAALKEGTSEEVVNLYVARGLKVEQKYDEAKKVLNGYLPRARNEEIRELARRELDNIDRIDGLADKSNYYRVKNLDDVNTASTEYSPVYSRGYLYFTSNRDGGKIYRTTGTAFTDIYRVASKGANVNLSTLDALDPIINHIDTNEGSVAISPDGNSMIFAKGNNGKAKGFTQVNLFLLATETVNGLNQSHFQSTWQKPGIPHQHSVQMAQAFTSHPPDLEDMEELIFTLRKSTEEDVGWM